MGVYSKYIFPSICDVAMSGERLGGYRKETMLEIRGRVLEIGFGTGLNLPHYPPAVEEIHAVDNHPRMHRLARSRIRKARMTVIPHEVSGESLPMQDESFDSVISTFTLCTISDAKQALAEVFRVLKPSGQFVFLEHGLSDKPRVRKWQHRLNPIQNRIGVGCHLNRDIRDLVSSQPFEWESLRCFELERIPGILGFCYQGLVKKPSLDEKSSDFHS